MVKTIKYDSLVCADCDFKELKKIRSFIIKHAKSFGFNDSESQNIALAVDEACSNLIKHAFKFDSEKKILIEIEKNSRFFTVKIMDDGAPFNPLEVEAPNMEDYFREYKIGGLGIQIMRKIMDEITYLPSKPSQGNNILTLKKALNQ